MIKTRFILALISLFLLTQCSTRTVDNPTTSSLPTSVDLQPEYNYPGEWIAKNTIWESAELNLQADGIFTFQRQNCLGQIKSGGRWINNKGIITLTSFDEYKPKPEALAIHAIVKQNGSKNQFANLSYEFKFSDQSNIYFDNIQLTQQHDTLFLVNEGNLYVAGKFYRKDNNK